MGYYKKDYKQSKIAVFFFLLKYCFIALLFVVFAVVLVFSVNAPRGNGPTKQILQTKNINGGPFQSSLTRGRFVLVKSLIDNHSFIVDKYAPEAFPDIIYTGRHYVSVFTPGATFLGAPLYQLGERYQLGVLFLYLLGPLASILSGLIVYFILLDFTFGPFLSLLITIIYLFGTNLFAYTSTFNGHPLSAFAIALAFAGSLLVIKQKRTFLGSSIFWFSAGLAFIVDFPNAFTLLPMALSMFYYSISIFSKQNRKVLSINISVFLTTIFSLIFLIPLSIYIHSLFGTYFTTIENHQINGYINQQGKVSYHLLDNPKDYRDKKIVYKELTISSQYSLQGLYTLLLSPERGLFVFSPILLLALFGIVPFLQKEKELGNMALFSIFTTMLVYASYSDYAGGWSFGTRFFIGILPLIMPFLAQAVQSYLKKIVFLLFFIVFTIGSFFINTLGALTSQVIPSPIESEYANCGFNCSFMRDIPLINGHYASYFYQLLLNKFITQTTFFSCMVSLIVLLFLFLIPCFYFEYRKENHS